MCVKERQREVFGEMEYAQKIINRIYTYNKLYILIVKKY